MGAAESFHRRSLEGGGSFFVGTGPKVSRAYRNIGGKGGRRESSSMLLKEIYKIKVGKGI